MKKIFVFIFICVIIVFLSVHFQKKHNKQEVLQFSSWGSQSELLILKDILNDFQKENPNIKIEFIHIPQNYFQKLHLLFASNLAPDVIFINNINIPVYANTELLEDLTPYFKEEIKDKVFFTPAIDSLSVNNKLYAAPRDISNLVIYYNKTVFDKMEISYPDGTWNLEEFINTAGKVTSKDNFGINFETDSLYWNYYLASNGGGILSDDGASLIFTEPQSLNALQLFADLADKYHYAPTKSQKGSATSAQMFIQGKLAMYLSGRWMVPKFRESIKDFDWDVINFPASSQHKVFIDSSGWAISKKSKNKENAVKLIKFLSSEKSAEKFAQSGLIVPARHEAAKSTDFLSETERPRNSKIYIEMIKNAKPTPVNENFKQINDILNEAVEPVLNGDKTAREIVSSKLINKLHEYL